MFENIIKFFKKLVKAEETPTTKETAKERLHLVLMQDRANVSAEFLALMKQEIIEVIKKYIDVDENQIDVKLTNQENPDGTTGAPALYANIPIIAIKEIKPEPEKKEESTEEVNKPEVVEENNQEIVEEKPENTDEHVNVVEEVTEPDNVSDKSEKKTKEEIVSEDGES